jgi:hypothetical protein
MGAMCREVTPWTIAVGLSWPSARGPEDSRLSSGHCAFVGGAVGAPPIRPYAPENGFRKNRISEMTKT